jgi:hypothetical protein
MYERVLTEAGMVGSDHRWRVIHAQVVHPDDFTRFGKLNLVAEVNPYHVSDDMRWMIPSGVGWQGLGEIYRESIVGRSPETLRFELRVPENAFLDLALGTVEDGPVTFKSNFMKPPPSSAGSGGLEPEVRLLQ